MRLTLVKAQTDIHVSLPLAEGGISAGFPSPAENFIERRIDLNRTWLGPGIYVFCVGGRTKHERRRNQRRDLLVIRKTPYPIMAIYAFVFEREFTLKRVKKEQDKLWLLLSNEKYRPIEVHPDDELTVWG